MGLRIWLPLINDIKNYGASDFNTTVLGSLGSVSGKLGSAYKFDDGSGTGNGISLNTNLLGKLGNNFSIACWVNPYGNHVHYNGTIFSSGNWNNKCWAFGLSQDNTKVDAFGNRYNTWINCSVPTNTWTHLVCTNNNGTCSVYKNGVFVGTGTSSSAIDSDASNCCVGRETYASGYFGFNGSIQDLRVYDHCLSDNEIKELSKALVLYYPLDKTSIIGANLITSIEAGGRTTLINKYSMSANFGDNGDTYIFINCTALELNKTYTLSFDVENFPIESKWNWSLWNDGDYTIPYITKSGHYEYTFTPEASKLPSGYSLTKFLFDDGSRINPKGTVIFRNFKIELGYGATQFSTSSTNSKLCDNSGYNRYILGSATYFPQIKLDSGKNGSCCWFNSSDIYLSLNSEPLSIFTTGSIEWWAKVTTIGSSGLLPFTGQTTGYYLAASSNWTGAFYNGNVTATSGSSIKYYIDGVENNTPSGKDSKWHHYAITGINLSTWTALYLNHYSSAWNGTDVCYSEIKFYNTILSSDDVSKDYHTFASIYQNKVVNISDIKEFNTNLLAKTNAAIVNQVLGYGVARVQQTNCQCTLTNNGFRIYRPANISASSQNQWGGFVVKPFDVNNQDVLYKGHTYIIKWHVKGKSSNAGTDIGWSNRCGWGGGGLMPSPSSVSYKTTPANFDGEMDCFYKWTINDDVYKVCTSSYSVFVQGETYLSYRDFKFGFTYTDTGEMGTDIYVTNVRLYDVTANNQKVNITTSGILNGDLMEGNYTDVEMHMDGEIYAKEFNNID